MSRRYTILPNESYREPLRNADKCLVAAMVCKHYSTNLRDIKRKDRHLHILEARHVLHYLLTANDKLRLRDITALTGRNYATVMHSRRTIENYIFFKNYNEKITEIIETIINTASNENSISR